MSIQWINCSTKSFDEIFLRFPSSIMASEPEFRHKPRKRQKETFLQTNFIYLRRFETGKNARLKKNKKKHFSNEYVCLEKLPLVGSRGVAIKDRHPRTANQLWFGQKIFQCQVFQIKPVYMQMVDPTKHHDFSIANRCHKREKLLPYYQQQLFNIVEAKRKQSILFLC